MAQPPLAQIFSALWFAELPRTFKVWTVLDAARDRRVYSAVASTYTDHCCLYSGELPPELKLAAPYLIALDPQDRVTRDIVRDGWGHSWGIFLRSDAGMETLRRHLKKFLLVKDPKGKRMIFRYYDPRVLRAYLPTCWPEELETFFGPIKAYMVEGKEPLSMVRFRFDGLRLIESSVRLSLEAVQAG
jgi:hypothetical protein